jgi:hypothetical protein
MPKRSFSPLWGCAVLCLVFGLTPSDAAQVAAGIEYETVARPADLPDDFQPLPGTSLKFLSIKTIDGFIESRPLATGSQISCRDDTHHHGAWQWWQLHPRAKQHP